jgi:hypothetical protein
LQETPTRARERMNITVRGAEVEKLIMIYGLGLKIKYTLFFNLPWVVYPAQVRAFP